VRIAVLSDTRLPTHISFPGHGLGKLALMLATGLKARGHEIDLYAGKGSAFDGMRWFDDEKDYLKVLLEQTYDVALDLTHNHTSQHARHDYGFINVSVDREASPGKNAIFPSEAHRRFHRYPRERARVIPHGIDVPPLPNVGQENYFAYLSAFFNGKQPNMAADAAKLAGVELIMAGFTPPAPPAGVRYIGALAGDDKHRFLAKARGLLYPASTESGGLVPLEAAAMGTPSIVSAFGGAAEQILEGVTGFAVKDTEEMAAAIKKVDSLDRAKIRQWVMECRSVDTMLDAYERACTDVANGVTW
jgi:glycosyltransferase involved in cell wall biosynthesis